MRKRASVVVPVVAVVIVLFAVLAGVVETMRGDAAPQPPLTAEDLDRIATRIGNAPVSDSPTEPVISCQSADSAALETVPTAHPPLTIEHLDQIAARVPTAHADGSAGSSSSSMGPEATIAFGESKPTTLESTAAPPLVRAVTDEERSRWPILDDRLKASGGVYRLVIKAALRAQLEYNELMAGVSGRPWYCEQAANDARRVGDWETARRYSRKILRDEKRELLSPLVCEYHLMDLAWLENDPVQASRLLEMSCATNSVVLLGEAVQLSRATGSVDATEYYLARLRAVDPD